MNISDGVWSLIVALVGVSGTLFGVFRTQRQADRRTVQERAQQDARDAARNRREDAARTYEHRREAYGTFLQSFETHLKSYWAWQEENGDEQPPPDSLDALIDARTQVEIYGSQAASDRAKELYGWMSDRAWRAVPKDHWKARAPLMEAYVRQVRVDLGVPE